MREKGYTRGEIHSSPNKEGKYSHTRFWMADYHPGHPEGEDRWAERGQCFLAELPPHESVEVWVDKRNSGRVVTKRRGG